MSYWMVFGLALALALDAFAVAVTVGMVLPRLSFRPVFRLAWHFGLFQFLMPVIGWAAGLTLQRWIEAYDHWVAFGLLVLIGGKMVRESFEIKKVENQADPTRGWNLVILSVATSVDALAVGLMLALLGVSVWGPGVIIGVVAATLTFLGLHLGRKLGHCLGARMELIGGLVLIGIGLKILISHLIG